MKGGMNQAAYSNLAAKIGGRVLIYALIVFIVCVSVSSIFAAATMPFSRSLKNEIKSKG
jgi:hypothetical protein